MNAPHVQLTPGGGLTVVYTAEQRKVIEGRDRCSQGHLCDLVAEQVFVAECVSLTETERVS